MKRLILFFLHVSATFSVLISLSGCASIPKAAPELSAELGNRLSAIESSHVKLLHEYFDQKRAVVDEFVEEEWLPVFADEFFADTTVQGAWEEIVASNDKTKRLEFIVLVGPKLQAMINAKRLELIKPLDDLENQVNANLTAEYNQARSINNTLTSFLASASKVEENRQRYLDQLGITDEKIGRVIDATDEAVAQLLHVASEVADKKKQGEDFLARLKEIKKQFVTKTDSTHANEL